jgi:TRAP-type mannitol/chloroaromatic compound transport system permease small subunit
MSGWEELRVADRIVSGRSATRPAPALASIIKGIDGISTRIGQLTAWLILPMTLAICYEVGARHFFRAPTIWAYDVTYMLYGTHFMLGAAYTLRRGGHVRTDMLYQGWPPRRQHLVDAVGYLFFFFPGMLLILYFGWQEAWHAWELSERSEASPWRPIIYPFKAVIPLTALLLLVQGVAELLKSLYTIRTGRLWEKREVLEL